MGHEAERCHFIGSTCSAIATSISSGHVDHEDELCHFIGSTCNYHSLLVYISFHRAAYRYASSSTLLHRSYPSKISLLLSQRLPQLRNKSYQFNRASEDHHHGSLVSLHRSNHHYLFSSNVVLQPVAVALLVIITVVEIAVIAVVVAAA